MRATLFTASLAAAASLAGVAAASDFRVSEWLLSSEDCADKPASSYAIVGPNFIVRPSSTCIFDPVEFSALFKTGTFVGPARCFYSEGQTNEMWAAKVAATAKGAPDLEALWDVTAEANGTLSIGDATYKRCPAPLYLPE